MSARRGSRRPSILPVPDNLGSLRSCSDAEEEEEEGREDEENFSENDDMLDTLPWATPCENIGWVIRIIIIIIIVCLTFLRIPKKINLFVIWQNNKRFSSGVTVHRSKSDVVLPFTWEKTSLLFAIGSSLRTLFLSFGKRIQLAKQSHHFGRWLRFQWNI